MKARKDRRPRGRPRTVALPLMRCQDPSGGNSRSYSVTQLAVDKSGLWPHLRSQESHCCDIRMDEAGWAKPVI